MSFLKFEISVLRIYYLVKFLKRAEAGAQRQHLPLQTRIVRFHRRRGSVVCIIYHAFEEFGVCGIFAELLNKHFKRFRIVHLACEFP